MSTAYMIQVWDKTFCDKIMVVQKLAVAEEIVNRLNNAFAAKMTRQEILDQFKKLPSVRSVLQTVYRLDDYERASYKEYPNI